MPVKLYRRDASGNRERVTDHPVVGPVTGFANPWTPATDLRTRLQADVLTHGAGFGRVVRVQGTVREIHRLKPTAVSVWIEDDGAPSYRYTPTTGGEIVLGFDEVIHLGTPGSEIDKPVSIVSLCREAIGLDIAMCAHQGRVFRDGGRPSGILKTERQLAPDSLKRLRDAWSSGHAGENSGRTAILENGLSFQQIALSFVDAQFLELRRFAVEEIARAFRVPAVLINDLERATWRNVEELSRLFFTFTLLPWLETWEGALSRALLTEDERRTLFLEFETGDLLRGDTATRFAAYREASGSSWLTPNEVRALENRPPVPGGDELVRQAGQAPATTGGTPNVA